MATSTFPHNHDFHQSTTDFIERVGVNLLSQAELAARIPTTIMDCLCESVYRDRDDINGLIDARGVMVSYNPENLSGFYPPERWGGTHHGKWNMPFIFKILYIRGWHRLLHSLYYCDTKVERHGNCSVCDDLLFDLHDPQTYAMGETSFYMCPNSTKDNYHLVCDECYDTIMTNRFDRFTKNPACPCCREEPDAWLGFATNTLCLEVNDLQDIDLTFMAVWMKSFYQGLRSHILLDEVQGWADNFVLLERRFQETEQRCMELTTMLTTEKVARSIMQEQIEALVSERTRLQSQVVSLETQKLRLLTDKANQLTKPETPAILGKRERKPKKSVRTTIQEKFRKLHEEANINKDEDDEDDLN